MKFVEIDEPQKCPHCEQEIDEFEFRTAGMSINLLSRTIVTVVSCPHCKKVLAAT